MLRRLQLGIGFCLYLAAFFLPAVKPVETGPGAGPVLGWVCALFALAPFGGLVHGAWQEIKPEALTLLASGLVNLWVLVYLVSWIWPRLVRSRLAIGVLALGGVISSWFFLGSSKLEPLIGHFLWVAGITIMLGTEVWLWNQAKPETDPGASR